MCLVKPQFEAGREKVGKKGVVRDKKVHLEVVCDVMTYAISIGFQILALSFSPIKGPEGNIEYLLYIEKGADLKETEEARTFFEENYLELAKSVVNEAHGELD